MGKYIINSPAQDIEILEKIEEKLKDYQGRRIVDPSLTSKEDILRDIHIGAVSSVRCGFCPLVINYCGKDHSYMTLNYEYMEVTFEKDKITCLGRIHKGYSQYGGKIDMREYIFLE